MTHDKDDKDEVEKKGDWSFRLVCITCVAYLIIPAVAYGLASLNEPNELIKDFMNETEIERTGEPMSDSDMESLFGLLVAVVALGAAVGGLTSDPIADRIGRKYAILIATVANGVGSLIMALCKTADSYEMLFVGRTLVGLALGWGLGLAPPYIMEMCQPDQKGAAAMANMVVQGFGILATQILGYEELLGNRDYWIYLIGFPLVLSVVQLLLFPFCPQNPRYLLMQKKDEAGAIKALQTIRGHEDVQDDIKQLNTEMVEAATDAQVSVIKLFVTPRLRRPLIVAIAMGLHQNWCGMNGILLFSEQLFEDAGVSGSESRYATSGVGAVAIVGNLLAVLMLPRTGRKTLFVGGTVGIGVCSAIFALLMVFKDEADALKYVSIVVALILMIFYAAGPVSVFWVILGEMFPHSARGAGVSVALMCVFSGFFSHCYAFPAMKDAMSSYTFFVFAGIDVIMVVFCVFYMPETKDKTFAEIALTWTKDGDLESQGEQLKPVSSFSKTATDSSDTMKKSYKETSNYAGDNRKDSTRL